MSGLIILIGTVLLTSMLGCTQANPRSANIELRDGQGTPVGRANLVEAGDGVRVTLEVNNLPPGPHGLHFHAVGKCEAPKFESAAGHYNPENKQHGTDNPNGSHAGDLPNITVAADGTGRAEFVAAKVSLGGNNNTLLDADGTALIIHAGPDDMKTDPSGNSGGRIACGVVTKTGS